MAATARATFRHAIRCYFAVAKGPFWRPDACSLEPPNNSCRRQKKIFFLGIQKNVRDGFGTQLDAVLLWRRVPSGGLMLAAWQQLQEVEKDTFSTNSEGTLGVFVGKFEHGFGTQ